MKKNSFIEGTIIATIFIILVKILGMVYLITFYSIVGSQGAALYGYAYSIYSIFLSISALPKSHPPDAFNSVSPVSIVDASGNKMFVIQRIFIIGILFKYHIDQFFTNKFNI